MIPSKIDRRVVSAWLQLSFERQFLSQGEHENRSIEETLDIGWEVDSILPSEELYRLTDEEIEKYYDR